MSTAVLLNNVVALKIAISSIGQSPIQVDNETGESTNDVKGSETDRWVSFANYYAVQIFGLMSFVAGSASFLVMANFLAEVSSVFVIGFGILVGYQKTQLFALGDFRGQHIALKTKVDQFHQENVRLKSSIDGLAQETHKLKQVQVALDQAATASGKSADALVQIVQENGRLQKEILEKLNAEVVMQIMTTILNTDRDQDFILNAKEVNVLIMRLQNIAGVVFREEVFRKKIHNDEGDLTLTDVCAIAHEMQDPTVPDADRVFVFRPQSVLEQ
jgi:hypothetical protein